MNAATGGAPGHIVIGGTGVGQLCCPRLVLGAIASRASESPRSDDAPRQHLRIAGQPLRAWAVARSTSRRASRSAIAWRLSQSFLPRAMAISTLIRLFFR